MPITFAETLHQGYAQTMEVPEAMLVDEHSPYQHIQIFDTPVNGRVMALDGIVQISDRDEASYSEMLTHVPLFELPAPAPAPQRRRRVFIVGGGDGAVAEEALKHPDVQVDMCEIDAAVIAACRTHFAHVHHGVFDHPRFSLHIADAFEHLKRPENRGAFDLIIADRPDPVGPATVLFGDDFYALVRDALSETGVVVFQNGVPFFQPEELRDTLARLRALFPHAGVYLTVTPSYTGGFMALAWASKGTVLGSLAPAALAARVAAAGLATDYYNADIHHGAFALPEWIKRLAGK